MDTKLPAKPNEIRELLEDSCRDIYNGLLHGSEKVREYFDQQSLSVNKPLAANIARFHAKQFIETSRSIGEPYYLREVPNNGIAIRQDLFELKVIKGLDGNPPAPSKSKRSELFYSQSDLIIGQQRFLPFPGIAANIIADGWEDFRLRQQKLNLLLFWEADKDYSITQLQLVCPRQSWKYRQQVKVFWREIIPHPVLGIVGMIDVNQGDEDLEDLVIHIDVEAEAGNEQ